MTRYQHRIPQRDYTHTAAPTKICNYKYEHGSGYKEYCDLPANHEGLIHGAGGAWRSTKTTRRLECRTCHKPLVVVDANEGPEGLKALLRF